jgi:hypothetical protein
MGDSGESRPWEVTEGVDLRMSEDYSGESASQLNFKNTETKDTQTLLDANSISQMLVLEEQIQNLKNQI